MEENVDIQKDIPEDQLMGVPLFLRKLWKLVNDQENEHIICWNKTENGFLILDQLEFITKLLPHYFKHNNMSSFVRQLNFYNFHKVATINDEIEFVHKCFIKGVPEVLILIKRKSSVVKQKGLNMDEDLKDFLNDVKNLRNKNALIQKELILLKQENMTLWSELNSLRNKYEKQSSVINKLINFLISYIHTHGTYGNKQDMGVPRRSNQSNLKSSPKLLELDYRGKQKNVGNKTDETSYAMFPPGSSNSHGTITYSVKIPESLSKTKKNVPSLQEILAQNHPSSHRHNDKLKFPMNLNRGTLGGSPSDGITYSIKLPSDQSGKMVSTDIQKSLYELLNENKRLSMEDSLEDLLTEINAVDEPVMDMGVEYRKPIQEFEPAFSNSAGDTYYTVSYPTEFVQNIQSQKDTSVTTPIMQSQISYSSTAPAKFSKIVEVNNNMNIQPEFTDTRKVSSVSEIRSQKDNSTEFQPNLSTSNSVGNTMQSEQLFNPSPSEVSLKYFKTIKTNNSNESIELDDSMVNQSLLEILKENQNLSRESTNDYTLGTQQKNSIEDSTVVPLDTVKKSDLFSQRNMKLTSPTVEPSSDIEIEYIVEAPNSNLNPSLNPSTSPSSVSVGSKNYNILSNPNSYVGKVVCPIERKSSLSGYRQHRRNTNLQINKATSTKVERKRLKSAGTEATLKSFKTKPLKMNDSLLKSLGGNESLSCENPHDGVLSTYENSQGNSIGVPSKTNNQLMRKMRLLPKKNGKQIIKMPSEKRTDEPSGTMELTIPNPEIRNNISPLSVPLGSQKSNLLRNPNVIKVYRADNEDVYPVENRSILIGSQQKPSNTKLQMNTHNPAGIKNIVISRKRLKSAEAEPTLKSFKIPKTKSIGTGDLREAKVKQSLLNILKENENLSVENPKNTLIVSSDTNDQPMRNIELQENGEPFIPIESPTASDEIESQYIVQAPDSNSNPGIDDMELTEILDELPATIPESTVESSPNIDVIPPLSLSVGNNEFSILENPNTYLESPQDDLNVLQEILNNLDSKDLSDILSNDSNMNVDNLSCLEDENPIDIPISQSNSTMQGDGTNSLLDSSALVDQYFSPHFFDQNVQ